MSAYLLLSVGVWLIPVAIGVAIFSCRSAVHRPVRHPEAGVESFR
jgi:hypothetical protein